MIGPTLPLRFGLRLRAVTLEDSAFIIEQRRLPRARSFLGDTSTDVDAQKHWISEQRKRVHDIYWICEREDQTAVGAIGLYGIGPSEAEWGRFFIRPGSKAAPGCLWACLTYAFGDLDLKSVFCTTVANNHRAVAFYERAGFEKEEGRQDQIILGGKMVTRIFHRLHQKRWHAVQNDLAVVAAQKTFEL